MLREELIKKVALKMDEISSSDDVIVAVGADDNNPLYAQINSLLNESINDVLTKAPIYRLQNHIITAVPAYYQTFSDRNGSSTRQAAVFAVPEKFIRIAAIYDALFERPIVDLAIEGDDVAKMQRNRFLMAGTAKPVAVLGRDSNGSRLITCYSFPVSEEPDTYMNYIERFVSDEAIDNNVDIDDYLVEIVTWVCAGKVFAAHGDLNRGKICDDNAAALMI